MFSGEITKPMLVVNGFITPDSLIKVHVSKSEFFLSNKTTFENINNATVNVWINGTKIEKLSSIGQGYYQTSFKPQTGDTIKITAENADFSEVSTFTEVVNANQILATDTTNHVFTESPMVQYSSVNYGPMIPDTIGYTKTESFDLKIKFKDPSSIANFYKLNLKMLNYYDNDSTAFENVWFNSDDMVFGNNNNNVVPIEAGYYSYNHEFTDELFNGKEYNLKLTFSTNSFEYKDKNVNPWQKEQKTPIKRELYIEFQSISESYFKYIRSRSASASTIEFFSEPVQIYSNIKGGIGILGSYSNSVYKLPLK
jgi:hypothetical protein